jgi:hypothetical protein
VSSAFTESVVAEAALERLETAGLQIRNAEIAPGERAAERNDHGEVVRTQRLGDALLQQLISDELRVQGAERAIKETTV